MRNPLAHMDAAGLVCDLHGKLLRALSAKTGRHFQGLEQASRVVKLSNSAKKQVRRIDAAFNIVRHITAVRCHMLLEQVSRELDELDMTSCPVPTVPDTIAVSPTASATCPGATGASPRSECPFAATGVAPVAEPKTADCALPPTQCALRAADQVQQGVGICPTDVSSAEAAQGMPGADRAQQGKQAWFYIPGDVVKLQGLLSETSLNESVGRVLNHNVATSRVAVKIPDTGRAVLVRPTHRLLLERVRSQAATASHSESLPAVAPSQHKVRGGLVLGAAWRAGVLDTGPDR